MDSYEHAGGNSPQPRFAGKQSHDLIVNDPSKFSQLPEHMAEVTNEPLQRGWVACLQVGHERRKSRSGRRQQQQRCRHLLSRDQG